jgi:hypothetical protein
LLIAAIQPVPDPDFWWHLPTGNWILSHHAVPRHDLFTLTVWDHRWITHEWLSEVILALLYAAGAAASGQSRPRRGDRRRLQELDP